MEVRWVSFNLVVGGRKRGGDVGELFGTGTGTLCDCVVFGEPLTTPVLSSSSRLGKVRQPPPPTLTLSEPAD